MKSSKIVKYLQDALGQDNSKKKGAIKKIIDKMKKKDHRLKEKLASAKSDKDKSAIKAKIEVNRAHRKKGVKAYRKLSGKS